jgi:hypothetical protein
MRETMNRGRNLMEILHEIRRKNLRISLINIRETGLYDMNWTVLSEM